MRGRLEALGDKDASQEFQSTPPCGGDGVIGKIAGIQINFNPRPHAGATGQNLSRAQEAQISIHAPMRGRRLD